MSHPLPDEHTSSPGALGELLTGITSDLSTLFRQEV